MKSMSRVPGDGFDWENVIMQWVCSICGYVHDDEEAPPICPVCGAPQSKFAEYYEDDEEVLGDEYRERDSNDDDDYYGQFDE